MKQIRLLYGPVVLLCVIMNSSGQTAADPEPKIDLNVTMHSTSEKVPPVKSEPAPEVIFADETKPWQIPLFTVLATRYTNTHLFVSGKSTPQKVQATLNVLESLNPRHILAMDGTVPSLKYPAIVDLLPHQTPELLSEYLASMYWTNPDNIVIVKLGDPDLAVLGAVYAHYLKSPLLYFDSAVSLTRLAKTYPHAKFHIYASKKEDIEGHKVKGKTQLRKDIVEKMKRKKEGVKNLIVARYPNVTGDANSAWLTGYASIRRNAPVVFVRTTKADSVEKTVNAFKEKYSLKPRSITLLASEDEIGRVTAVIENSSNSNWSGLLLKDEFFTVDTEPFCMPVNKALISWSVGRIPFPDAVTTSLFLCHIYSREWVKTGANKHVVMVSNPEQETGQFPLAETISRLTAKEIRNFRYSLDEFYGVKSNDSSINKAMRNADLVIFEGHIEDQLLLEDPSFFRLDDDDTPIEVGKGVPSSLPFELFEGMFANKLGKTRFSLPNHPILILQSCNSLRQDTLAQFAHLGGAGVIGSRTKIHSASGSAFMHCFIIRALYEGKTIGEALTEARNYFLCMQDVKDTRGHKEQAKSLRVALSFSVWGDPESRLLSPIRRAPSREPITIRWENEEIILEVPEQGLPMVKTEHYKASMFPASQTAGLTRRSKLNPTAPVRIVPLYFFALDNPKGNARPKHGVLSVNGDTSRAVYRVDTMSNKLFVVYFPNKEVAGETIRLKFTDLGTPAQ